MCVEGERGEGGGAMAWINQFTLLDLVLQERNDSLRQSIALIQSECVYVCVCVCRYVEVCVCVHNLICVGVYVYL